MCRQDGTLLLHICSTAQVMGANFLNRDFGLYCAQNITRNALQHPPVPYLTTLSVNNSVHMTLTGAVGLGTVWVLPPALTSASLLGSALPPAALPDSSWVNNATKTRAATLICDDSACKTAILFSPTLNSSQLGLRS